MYNEQKAIRAYRAYGAKMGGVNYLGNPLPEWDELPLNVQSGWKAVAEDLSPEPKPLVDWRKIFDERNQKEIAFAEMYNREFRHGATGHNSMIVIALMADLLDKMFVK